MNTSIKTALAAAFALCIASAATADDKHHKHGKTSHAAASEMTDAEVRKIDLEGGKITLKHAEIKHLEMPGMTMVFVAKDKSQLEKLKAGDKVKFKAVSDGGKFIAADIQLAP